MAVGGFGLLLFRETSSQEEIFEQKEIDNTQYIAVDNAYKDHASEITIDSTVPAKVVDIEDKGQIDAIVSGAVFLLFVVIASIFCYKSIGWAKSTGDDEIYILSVISGVVSFSCFIGLIYQLKQLWFVTCCPRLYLMEEVAKYIKSMS